ncbi:MAG: thioredoxin fold domain-containing protein [Gammaproteobacteria bacterium]
MTPQFRQWCSFGGIKWRPTCRHCGDSRIKCGRSMAISFFGKVERTHLFLLDQYSVKQRLIFAVRTTLTTTMLGLLLLSSAQTTADNAATDDNLHALVSWTKTLASAKQSQAPIVVLLEQRHCAFCQRLKRDLIRPLANDPTYRDRAIFVSVLTDIDAGLIEKDGTEVSGFEFSDQLRSSTTPTVLFLDSAGNELQKRIVGYKASASYTESLKKKIEESIAAVQSQH